jgi:hypothetical protein
MSASVLDINIGHNSDDYYSHSPTHAIYIEVGLIDSGNSYVESGITIRNY